MPKYSQEMELEIKARIERGDKNADISRELGVYRGAVSKRRKEYLKRKQEEEKPETEDLKQKPDHEKTEKEPEITIQQEQNDSHPLDPQIYTLIRYQGTHSQEEALSQAIETQHSFNPYILNHGFNTPAELVKFFEDELKLERALAKDLILDVKISQSLIVDYKKTIAELEELAEERYEEGKNDHALLIPCSVCGESITLEPGDEVHRLIVEFLRERKIIHSDCGLRYKRIYV